MTKGKKRISLFLILTLIAMVVFVDLQKTTNFIYSSINSTTISMETHHLHFSKNLRAYKERKLEEERQRASHIETPEAIRSIYISSWIAGTPSLRSKLISFVKSSDINSVTIDIKDSTGVISFPFKHDLVDQTKSPRVADMESFIAELHQDDIYVIGRLTTFQDPLITKKHPDLAFKRLDNGNIWTDRKGLAFINPAKEVAWDYLSDIAEYSYNIGFDEINFDYIRYPSDGSISNIDYDIAEGETRASTMKSFYEYVDDRLRSQGIPISADIFGLVTTAEDDIGIGQIFEDIYPHFDGIAPMVYPSHYGPGYFGYSNPNAQPYGVVKASMQSAVKRAEAINEDPQKLRTWIQDFNLGTPAYGISEVKAQIEATYDIGLDSYMSWDPRNKYTQNAYR